MKTSDQLNALQNTSVRNRDELIFEFSKLDSQLRKLKTNRHKAAWLDDGWVFDFVTYPTKKR